MKVLQLIMTNQLRGAELFAIQLSNKILGHGHQVEIVMLKPGEAQLPFKGRSTILAPSNQIHFFDWQRIKALAQFIETEKPDIIQANAGDTLRIAVLSKLIFRWRSPIVFRNASTISSYIKKRFVKWFYNYLYKKVDYIISVSEFSKKDFISMFPPVTGKIAVIPVGVEGSVHSSVQNHHGQYIIHVGGFSFEKNHQGLLRIFNLLGKSQPDLELWLVGDGSLRQETEHYARTLGIQNKVKFLGYQSNVFEFLKGAKALALPSVIEGLPAVILEAMYCRIPVVAYDVGGISEVVRTSQTGWLLQVGDEVGFAEAIQEVLTRSFPEIIENAFQMVNENYNNDSIAKRFLNVYKQIINDSSGK